MFRITKDSFNLFLAIRKNFQILHRVIFCISSFDIIGFLSRKKWMCLCQSFYTIIILVFVWTLDLFSYFQRIKSYLILSTSLSIFSRLYKEVLKVLSKVWLRLVLTFLIKLSSIRMLHHIMQSCTQCSSQMLFW